MAIRKKATLKLSFHNKLLFKLPCLFEAKKGYGSFKKATSGHTANQPISSVTRSTKTLEQLAQLCVTALVNSKISRKVEILITVVNRLNSLGAKTVMPGFKSGLNLCQIMDL